MFDRTVVVGGGRHRHTHYVTEKRAPTDESVRLLKEMEEKADGKRIASLRLPSNHLDGVVHFERDFASQKFVARAHFKVNGHQLQVSADCWIDDGPEAALDKVKEAVAKEIATLFLCGQEAVLNLKKQIG